jgi:thioredoxin reductase
MSKLPVAIIGGGPVGLAAVAHLLERGETPILFEAGEVIGANIQQWGHVRMFSPWEYTVDSASVRLLKQHGWQMPPKDDLPTGNDLREQYMLPFADLPEVRDMIQLGAKVTAVSRSNVDKMKDKGREEAPFVLHIEYSNGDEALIKAQAVIDASGTWHKPNPIGANGLPAVGEKRHHERIVYGIPDVAGTEKLRYANKRVMVVGTGHSAINVLLELANLQQDYPDTQALWVMRGTNLQNIYGGQDDDALEARGQLGTRIQSEVDAGRIEIVAPFRVSQVTLENNDLQVTGETNDGVDTVTVDEIIASTGARPDFDLLRELRLDLDSSLESTRTLGPMIDPNIHSCGTVPPHGEAELRQPEKDFYIVGMKSYGRAPTFLLATGYEQVRSVVAGLVGDWESARDVQLNLPETGVCSTDFAEDGDACCGTPVSESAPALLAIGDIPVAVNAGTQQLVTLKTSTSNSCCGGADNCC